ncbi:hypothetical protein [Methylobacterium sp. Leaf85]|uniref:hypothetical protein n=1 Tax=Methylobacterium sp. Leaf85 TaxID=1736241 RepID=UPI0006F4382C|nr:hypothetical protein [Methylobacterium sp. Leaf85]KQO43057.1 hypothetical protein ASF08_10805 [Methylobacterium sp. Leaf85]
MAEETLLSASRRAVRFLRIDDAHGGLLSRESISAIDTLDRMVRAESTRLDQARADADAVAAESERAAL